ncbi:MAG: hypothetical protein MN733_01895 [Nitrososphaera sp.]|nr:hypothetical protein [Nitrososphaera sp.]
MVIKPLAFRQRSHQRFRKMEDLANELDKLLGKISKRTHLPEETRDRQARQVISEELSALRLLQAEDRLGNNLLIAGFSAIAAVLGGLIGYIIKLLGG